MTEKEEHPAAANGQGTGTKGGNVTQLDKSCNPEKLKFFEKIGLCAEITEKECDGFLRTYRELVKRGDRGETLTESLKDHYAGLRNCTKADLDELLKELYKYTKTAKAPPVTVPEAIPQDANRRAEELLRTGKALDFIAGVIGRVHFGDGDLVKLLWLSAAAIRLDLIHWLLVGSPGSGKSDLARKVLETIPEEHKVKLDDCSPKAFYYAETAGISLSQRVICIDDVRPDTGTVAILKALASDGRGSLQHWTVDDQRKFMAMQIPEDVLVIATTIQSLTDQQGQLLRRYQIVNPDESKEALVGVTEMIKRAARMPHEAKDPIFEQDVATAKAIYKRIVQEDLKVAIPFDFEYKLERNADKTTLKAFMALVKALALVNFPNRVQIGPVILATEEDLEQAGKLWRSTRALKIDETAERVLNCLPRHEPIFDMEIEQEGATLENFDRRLYRASDIAKELQLAPRTVQDKLRNLYDAGLIDRKKTELRGRPWVSWRVDDGATVNTARVKDDTYEREVRDTIRNLTDRYGGDPEALYTIIARNRNNQFGQVENPDKPTDRNYTAPRPSAQEKVSDGNGGFSAEIEQPLRRLRFFTAPRKTSPSFDEQRQQEGAAIITAEKEVRDNLDEDERQLIEQSDKELAELDAELNAEEKP